MSDHIADVEPLPLLTVRDMVLYVNLEQSVSISRPRSVAAAKVAMSTEEKALVVVARRDAVADEPGLDALYRIGTRALIRRLDGRANGAFSLLLFGTQRVYLDRIEDNGDFRGAYVSVLPQPEDSSDELQALHRQVLVTATKIEQSGARHWPCNLIHYMAQSVSDPLDHARVLASLLQLDVSRQQAIHESPTRLNALSLVNSWLEQELSVIRLQQKITR